MSIPIFQVDAFTAKPFAGNPAAVCLLKEEGEADWMQSVATEMNLSETAFLTPQKNGFGLRWFTPKTEVDLCVMPLSPVRMCFGKPAGWQ